MSLRLVSFSTLAAFAVLVAVGACTGTINLVDSTSTTGGDSSSAGGASSDIDGGCPDACPFEGATRCKADGVRTCTQAGSCLSWSASVDCPSGQTCNSTFTACAASGIDGGCPDECPVEGATRCKADVVHTCAPNGACLAWSAGVACPSGQGCNNAATECITSPGVCDDSSDCGCNCECVANQCLCTLAIPPTCTTDADCGPVCFGLICVGNQCVPSK